jgi:hypothetical protein
MPVEAKPRPRPKAKSKSKPKTKPKLKATPKSNARRTRKGVVLLAGGNPQIAKQEGDAAVQAYIAAMPGWKRDIGQRLDALIERVAPKTQKAIKWNSPFYGIPGKGWFLSFHVFTKYVKVTFFKGTSLRPNPPGTSKHKEVRYLDIHENDFDPTQTSRWIKQAASVPGWMA